MSNRDKEWDQESQKSQLERHTVIQRKFITAAATRTEQQKIKLIAPAANRQQQQTITVVGEITGESKDGNHPSGQVQLQQTINSAPIIKSHRESAAYDFFDCDEDIQQIQEYQESQTAAVEHNNKEELTVEGNKKGEPVMVVGRKETEETRNTTTNRTLQQNDENSPQTRFTGSRRRNAILSFGVQEEEVEAPKMRIQLKNSVVQNPDNKMKGSWKCPVTGCTATFNSAQALKGHTNVCGKNDEIECPNKFCANRLKEPGKKYKGLKGLNIHRKKCDLQQPK